MLIYLGIAFALQQQRKVVIIRDQIALGSELSREDISADSSYYTVLRTVYLGWMDKSVTPVHLSIPLTWQSLKYLLTSPLQMNLPIPAFIQSFKA